ncbi:branched-chain amino acid aminotransferase [Gordonia sp. (in: high G+C Gram-positive bacteria)]|uniref:branched-chain amino acid aminotransferase n=1 Tax=Gordonia sp. (in: high G+C Gram-positive bacteria) TaxID=84139 RepID=UPI001699D8BF|nr:branched-chain amino acid aminotransferase [Gordonia sp. (in: high G+C Gram-positive bacteria)]NLG46893.1 branched-chain amino acid aminotransferase [Gordonia sp. (in: high G+C Gram-positive bacteria)]
MTLQFTRTEHPHPVSENRRAEILAAPGFGNYFTDNMIAVDYDRERGWHGARVTPYGPIALDPAAMVLHYAQEIFEGLKAYRQPDGSIAAFRPEANAARFNASARRLAMPELDEADFLGSLRALLAADHAWVPAAGGEESLYLRPFMFASEASLGVRPSDKYVYSLIASPAGAYFKGGLKPVSVYLCTEYVRAVPGGTGDAKFGGNYAASLLAQAQAAEKGADQVVWLDALERRYIEEMGGMNLFFVYGSGSDAQLVTPELTGSLLPGITRSSLLTLAADSGYKVDERRISVDELREAVANGDITEVFACGTAAVITPVGRVQSDTHDYLIGDGTTGEVTQALRNTLTGLQRGTVDDVHGWMTTLYPAP